MLVANPDGTQLHTQSSPKPPSLFEALLWHYDKLSNCPEDKIYSLIGLTSARGDSRLVIDYARGARQAFIDAVKYTLPTTQRLDIICGMQPGSNSLQLPSWVPDWTASYRNSIFDEVNGKQAAAGASLAKATISLDNTTLTVKGFRIGIISNVGVKSGLTSPNNDHEISQVLSAFYGWRSLLELPEL